VYANPVYANPVYANPVYANPVYANPGPSSGPPGALGTPMHSLVYPNPVYAFDRLDDREVALRFRASGARRSQARPAGQPGEETLATANGPAWDQDCVRVAVLDSGFDSVSVRLTRDAVTGNNNARAAGPPFDAFDVFDVDGDGYLDPVSGHGTFIAGIIHRLAPRAAVCVQEVVSSFGDGHEDVIISHLDALITHAEPPHIINLSFSGYVLDKPGALQAAIRRAIAKGIVVVASAGNDGIDRKAYPAAFRGVVAVAATGPGGPAPFSNHGEWVDACAPGVDLTSWFFTQNGVRARKHGYDPDDFTGWATWSGTSFAAPVVAGMLARAADGQTLTAAQGIEVLIDQPGLHRSPGYGTVINVLGAAPEYVW
jgi:subtilisin family serine protease